MNNRKHKDILDTLPIWKIEDDCIISTGGDYSVVFEVMLPEIYTMSAQVDMIGETRMESGDFRDLNELLVKAMNVLPENSVVHQQDWFMEQIYEPVNAVENYLDKASERHFNERPYMAHKCYVTITKTPAHRLDINSMKTMLVTGRLIPKEVMSADRRGEFFSCIDQYVAILTSSKLYQMRRMKGEELFDPKGGAGLIERYLSLSLSEAVVPLSDIQIDGNIMVGDKYVRFYGISDIDDMPDEVFTHNTQASLSSENSTVAIGFVTPMCLQLPVNHIYNQYIFKTDKNTVLPILQKRQQQMTGLGAFSSANKVNADLIQDYLDTQAATSYPPVRCHMNVMVWTEDKEKMSRIRNMTTSAIAKIGVRPRENSSTAAMLFWAGIPGAAAEMPSEEKFWTFLPQACCMLNLESVNTSGLSTYGVKVVDRLSGQPIMVDFSDEPIKKKYTSNRNKFILGPSGSGKSFLTNHLVRSYFNQGAHVVIVDVGDSYEGLCQMLGGKYLTYKPEKPIAFNPFFIEGRRDPDIEKLEAIKALLLSLWKKEQEFLSRLEETAVSLCVTGYFDYLKQNEAIFPCFNSFFEYVLTGFKGAIEGKNITDKHFDYEAFKLTMEPFYQGGEYDYLLNSRDNLDLISERLVVFELDNIKDNKILFPIVTIIIMDTFITKMRQLKGVRKIILIEEAWKAIMKQEMAEYIKYLYKTVRKYFGEAWIVTQEVDDIINSPIVKDSIINNADCKILMDQRKYQNKFEKVMEFLALTKREKNLALSLNRDNDPRRNYKEFFVSFGGQFSAVYGLEVSKAEYFAFTTEEPEKVAVKKQVALHGGNYDLGIRAHLETL